MLRGTWFVQPAMCLWNVNGALGRLVVSRADVDHVPWSVWTVFHRVPK